MKENRIYDESQLACWLTPSEVSQFLGLGLTGTYEFLANEKCHCVIRHGRRLLVNRDRLLQYLDSLLEQDVNIKDVI